MATADNASSFEDALQPLVSYYSRQKAKVPSIQSLPSGSDLPQPYRKLLWHQYNMTPTLEAFFNCSLALRVLDKSSAVDHARSSDVLSRWVLLVDEAKADTGPACVREFGAINILLHNMPEYVRAAIRDGVRPLGTILIESKIEQRHTAQHFFAMPPDAVLLSAMEVDSKLVAPHCLLYGRCNSILDSQGHTLAQVVEVIPPIPDAGIEAIS